MLGSAAQPLDFGSAPSAIRDSRDGAGLAIDGTTAEGLPARYAPAAAPTTPVEPAIQLVTTTATAPINAERTELAALLAAARSLAWAETRADSTVACALMWAASTAARAASL